jgi:hypothetical protein
MLKSPKHLVISIFIITLQVGDREGGCGQRDEKTSK